MNIQNFTQYEPALTPDGDEIMVVSEGPHYPDETYLRYSDVENMLFVESQKHAELRSKSLVHERSQSIRRVSEALGYKVDGSLEPPQPDFEPPVTWTQEMATVYYMGILAEYERHYTYLQDEPATALANCPLPSV